jgi:phage-related protein
MGLSQVSAVASGVGLNFEDTATALAVFAQNSLKGSDAGTSLKTMLMNLQPTTKKQIEQFVELGLITEDGGNAFYDLEGKIKPLNEIAGILNTSLGGLTDQERSLALETMFGSDAIRAANVLFKEGADGVTKMADAMGSISAADVAAARLDNLKGDVEFLTGSLETLGIQLYQSVQEPLRDVAQSAIESVDQLSQAFEEGGLSGLVEAVGAVLSEWIVMIAEAAPSVVEAAVGLLQAFIEGITSNIGTIAESALQIGMTLVNAILEMLPELTVAAATIVIALIQGLTGALPELLATAVEVIVLMAQSLVESIPLLVDAALQLITGLADSLMEALPVLIDAVPEIISSLMNALLTGIPQILEIGVQLLTAIVGDLPEIISQIVAVLPQIIDQVISTLITLIPLIVDAGIQVFVALVGALPEIIQAIVAAVPLIVESIVGKTAELIPVIIDAGVKLFIALIQNLPAIIVEIIKAVPQIIDGIVNAFRDAMPDIVEVGKNLIMGIWDGIKSMAGWLGDKISGFICDIKDWFTDEDGFDTHSPSKWARDVIGKQIPPGITEGFNDGISDMGNSIRRAVKNLDASVMMQPLYAAASERQAAMARAYSTNYYNSSSSSVVAPVTNNITINAEVASNIDVEMLTRKIARAIGADTNGQIRLRGGFGLR